MKGKIKKWKIIIIGVICLGLLAIASIFSIINHPETARADTSAAQISIESIYNFSLNSEGTGYKIKAKNRSLTEASIPRKYNGLPVVEIMDNGFISCIKLTKVVIPETVHRIGANAFMNCSNLHRILGMVKVTEIGNNAFASCKSLEYLTIPTTINKLGTSIIRNMTNDVYCRSSEAALMSLNENWRQSSSARVIYGNDLICSPIEKDGELIGYKVEESPEYDSTDDIIFKCSYQGDDGNYYPILEISEYAFSGKSFNSLVIDYDTEHLDIFNIIKMGAGVFTGISSCSIDIKVNIEIDEQSDSMFAGSYNLKSISFKNIDIIPNSTFNACPALTNINFGEESINKIPNNIKYIGERAFSECTSLQSLDIPDTITYIGDSAFENWKANQKLNFNFNYPKDSWESTWKNGAENAGLNFIPYNIILDYSDGTDGQDSLQVQYGTSMPTDKDAPQRANYHFKGYYFLQDNGEELMVYDDNMASDYICDLKPQCRLYAKWDPYEFDVELNPDNGEEIIYIKVKYGQAMPDMDLNGYRLKAPTKQGYEFEGYENNQNTLYYNKVMGSERNCDLTEDSTLTAKWKARTYTVTLEDHAGIAETIQVIATFECDMPSVDKDGNALTAPTHSGKEFEGYRSATGEFYYKSDMSSARKWTIDSDSRLFAYWEDKPIQSYEIEYQVEGGPDNFNNPNPTSFNQDNVDNDNIKFQPILLTSQYPIKKIYWNYNSIKEVPSDEYLETGKLIVYGKVVEPKAHLTFELNGGTINTENTTLNFGDVFTDKPTKLAYKFEGWLVKNKNVEEFQYNDVGNSKIDEITLYAVWKARVSDKPIAINTQLTQFVVTGDCAIALNGSFMTYCRIIISADVKNVHIYSTATRVNKYHMYIVAENRTSNLNVYLENLEIVAPNDQVAISVPTARTTRIVGIGTVGLNLYTYGTVIIHGGNGSAGVSNNWDGLDGRVAIDCDRITIFCGDDLYILGGNGGKNYLTGKHGDGGYAVDADEVRICRAEGNKIRIYGGDGINYTKSPFPSKTTVTYFD